MKNLLIILVALFVCSLSAEAQRGRIKNVSDTLQGSETVNFAIPSNGSYQSLSLEVTCTELGGTSDGTLILQGGLNTYSTINSVDFSNVYWETNDTLTITDAAVWLIDIPYPTHNQYRIQGAGTASDTTLISIDYMFK